MSELNEWKAARSAFLALPAGSPDIRAALDRLANAEDALYRTAGAATSRNQTPERVTELLATNNALLERARTAEARLAALLTASHPLQAVVDGVAAAQKRIEELGLVGTPLIDSLSDEEFAADRSDENPNVGQAVADRFPVDSELFDVIRSAYLRGYAWAKENGVEDAELYVAKAAYDYADKNTSAIKTTPAPVSEITEEMMLAGCKASHPSLFARGLTPLPTDGPATQRTMRAVVTEVTAILTAAMGGE